MNGYVVAHDKNNSYIGNPWSKTLIVWLLHNNQGLLVLRMECMLPWWVQFSTYNWCWHYARWEKCWAGLKKISKVKFFTEGGEKNHARGVAVICLVTKLCMKERQSRRVKEWQGEMDSYSHSRLPKAGTANSHVPERLKRCYRQRKTCVQNLHSIRYWRTTLSHYSRFETELSHTVVLEIFRTL